MGFPISYFLVLLFLSNTVLLVVVGIVLVRFRELGRSVERERKGIQVASDADRNSERDRQQLLMTMRLERRMSELEKCLRTLSASDRLCGPVAERPWPIDNAVRMARSGASIEELTRSCGLNIGEARLMQKLHSKARKTAAN